MSRRRPLVLAAGLALLILPLLVAPAAAQSERSRILAYWTPSRMASARPLDLTPVGTPRVPAAKGGIPGPPGGGGGGGGGGGSDVTGASWTNGGPVVDQTGKVYFTIGNSAYICSGSVINDNRASYSTVLTAGHCGFDQSTGNFVTNWMFIPNFDANPTYTCANTTYGCWTAVALVIHYGFRYAGGFNNQAVTHDWTFAVVSGGGKSASDNLQLDTTVGGSYGIVTNPSSTRLEAFGYPAARPYNGSDLTWCAGAASTDVSSSTGSTWGMNCNMTGGASGGPWFVGLDESNGTGGSVGSLNSYKYTGDSSHMYGPIFNSRTQATLTAALSTTSGNVVVGTAP